MGEGAVGLSHFVGFFALANGSAFILESIHKFVRQFLGERFTRASVGCIEHPADCQGGPACWRDFHRDLVCGTTHTAGPDFHARRDVPHGGVKYLYWVFSTAALADDIQGVIHHSRRRTFLATVEHVMNHCLDCGTVIADVREDFTLFWLCTTHRFTPSNKITKR